MIDFRLKTFLTLCKVLNYTKTAEILHITQPAVSQHIRYLEKEYEVKLFEYKGKNLALTDRGKVLYDFVLGVESSSQRMKLIMSQPKETITPLYFGTTLTIGEYIMPKLIAKLISDFPTMEITMEVDNTETLLKKLHNGHIDFALIEGQFDKFQYNSFLLSLESFIGVCSPKSFLNKVKVSFNEIFEERLILREKGSGSREIFEQILFEHNTTMSNFKKVLEIGNINVIKELVEKNLGVTFLYKEAVENELKEGNLIKINISDFDVIREFNFVFLKNSLHTEEYMRWYDYFKLNKTL